MRRVLVVLLLAAAGTALYMWRGALPGLAGSEEVVATAPVRKGDLQILMKAHGDVKAARSITLYAPFSVTDVKLVSITKSGTLVKQGDVVAVIDATGEQDKVKEQESNVIQADKETDKVKAQHRAVNEQDRLDQAQAHYDVEGAKLETRKQEVVSEIDGAKAVLALQTTERHLQELENSQTSRNDSQHADLNVVDRKRKKAQKDMNFAKDNITQLTMKAPMDGMLVVMPNWRSQNGFGQTPDFKPGDQAWPGATLAEIPDLKSLFVELTVEETDRGKIAVGQDATIKFDAIPDHTFVGKIKEISTTAQMVFDGWPPKKNFKARVDVTEADPRLRPNMSANADLVTEKLTGVMLIPSRAVFERGGRTIAWVKRGKRYEPRDIVIGKKGQGQSQVLSGLEVGENVALEQPAKDSLSQGGAK
jgi:multidrug resistance efflux pump